MPFESEHACIAKLALENRGVVERTVPFVFASCSVLSCACFPSYCGDLCAHVGIVVSSIVHPRYVHGHCTTLPPKLSYNTNEEARSIVIQGPRIQS